MKKLVCMIPTEGKSEKQIIKEAIEAFRNFKKQEEENKKNEPKEKEED